MRKLLNFLGKLSDLPDWLNWLLSVVEPLVVLLITVLTSYIAWCLAISKSADKQAHALALIKGIAENWKAVLVILVPLFYRTIRIFLEQAEEALGVKRPLRGEPKAGMKDRD